MQNHTGSLTSGHYTSIVRVQDAWMKADDECMSPFAIQNISVSCRRVL